MNTEQAMFRSVKILLDDNILWEGSLDERVPAMKRLMAEGVITESDLDSDKLEFFFK